MFICNTVSYKFLEVTNFAYKYLEVTNCKYFALHFHLAYYNTNNFTILIFKNNFACENLKRANETFSERHCIIVRIYIEKPISL